MNKLEDKRTLILCTEKHSTAELNAFNYLFFEDEFKKWIPAKFRSKPIWWFVRIITKYENTGEGKILMKELCKIMDEKQEIIILGLNPYGKRTYENLKRFYEKSGFKYMENDMMIRIPKEK